MSWPDNEQPVRTPTAAELELFWNEEVCETPVYKLADYCRRCAQLCKDNPHYRFYCPLCHQVACGTKRQGEWIVLPHYERSVKERQLRNDEYAALQKPCRGGPVDPTEDRAP